MILDAKNISKSFRNGSRELPVLKNLDLKIDKGEIVTIMGPSGSGKSTLLNILGTLDTADSGTIIVRGQNVDSLDDESLSKLRNNHIGFVFQFHHLLPEFTAIENVLIPARILGNLSSAEKHAHELFEYVELTDRMNHYPSQLSGGERLRVAVLRALINRPSLILADEPTGNLDKRNAEKLLVLFNNICHDFQQTMVLTTHDDNVAALGNMQFVLESGKLILQ